MTRPIIQFRRASVDDDVADLLGLAEGMGAPGAAKAVARYHDDLSASLLFAVVDGTPVGALGYRTAFASVTILHLAVTGNLRRRGVGSALLHELRRIVGAGAKIGAETDGDAVSFYASNGFDIASLGEKYPGVERFHVSHGPSASIASAGRVILLNGPSSSGKSTIASRLLDDLDTPWFHMPVDAFGAMRSESRTHALDPEALDDVLRRTRAGYHRAVAAMVHAGNDVVMDYVLSEPWRLDDLFDVMAGIDVVFVGVHCDVDELRRRERLRGDRPVGLAEAQVALVHAHADYDVEVNTTNDSAATCSRAIREMLDRRTPSGERSFDRLRREHLRL